MDKKLFSILVLAVLFFGTVSFTWAQEKVKLGTSVKVIPIYYLPPLTAEEKGFWKENGLEVEWVPFSSSVGQFRGVAAGAINIGLVTTADAIAAAARGLPVIIVSEAVASHPFYFYVRTDSPYRHPRELKGTRVGVNTLGSVTHAYGRIVAAALGIEKDVRFVGAGGVPPMLAGLKVGAFDALVIALVSIAPLKAEGVVRELVSVSDYLPKPWIEVSVFAQKDFVRSKPEIVRKMLRAIIQSAAFIRENPRWTMDKMKSFQKLSEEAARDTYQNMRFTTTGRVDPGAIENVRKFLIEYGILTEKVPAVHELFTNDFLPG